MLRYIGKRLFYMVITLFIIISLTFFLMKILPGTPFDPERFRMLEPAQQTALLERYGLNDPVPVQYLKYLGGLFKGDFGNSFFYRFPVSEIIAKRMLPSCLVGIQAIVFGLAAGLFLGCTAAWKHNGGVDYFTMFLAVIGISVPNFVAAALLQYFVGLKLGILPVAFWESWRSSVLPSVALCFLPLSQVARFARTEMLDVLSQDYITTARAKGMGQARLLWGHALRNSIIPVVTILGPLVVNLLTGSLAVESIYAIPGMGALFVESIKINDYTIIMGVTFFYSVFYVAVTLLVDILYCVIDPRIRLGGNTAGGD